MAIENEFYKTDRMFIY